MSDGSPILEIRDPAVDAQAVTERLEEAVAWRRKEGAYHPDLTQSGPLELRPGGSRAVPPDSDFMNLQPVHEALADMSARAQLRELAFTSAVPVVGSLIAAIRYAWSSIAARWIGQNLGNQQSGFNEATVRLGNELLYWQKENLWRTSQLERRVRELEAQLARREDVAQPKEDEL